MKVKVSTIAFSKNQSLVDLLNTLPKPAMDENFNWKEEYYKGKKKKYGL